MNPRESIDPDSLEPVALYDMLLALGEREIPVGFITAKIRYEPIDRLLSVSPRLHKGRLFIAEIDPENAERNGLVLYDDGTEIALGTRRLQAERIQNRHPVTYDLVQRELFGFVDSPDGRVRTYFSEFYPYPDQLFNWVLGIQIDLDELAAPFNRLRVVILSVGLLALLGSLLLAHTGARRIASPIASLAARLTDFSRGNHLKPVEARGVYEIRQAGIAFNEMISVYEQAERERDQARAQMLEKAKLASVGQLAAGIGHEINNPLHNILALTKLVNRQHPDLAEAVREDIAAVHKEAQRASRIVRALLNFSRETDLERSVFEVGPWLEETLSLVGQEAKQQGVQVENEIEDEYLLKGDPNLLQQALLNLLVNGLQASDSGQRIRVITAIEGERLRIEVKDQGSGIPGDIRDRMFDPFFTTKSARGGSGLGLSISLGIVTQHGGELHLENQVGAGLKAIILLPGASTVPREADRASAGTR